MEVEALFRVRGNQPSIEQLPQGSMYQGAINPRGDVLVAQALPERTEITRMRKSFQVIQASAVAPVVALPTTTNQVGLWNGEQDSGRLYVIDAIGATCVVSAGAATGIGLCCMLNVGKKTAPTSGGLTIRGTAGQVYSGSAIVSLATGSLTDDGWFPVGNSVVGPASQIGLNVEVPINGAFIVPPGYFFHTAVLANTVTTITVKQWIRWHEILLPIGS